MTPYEHALADLEPIVGVAAALAFTLLALLAGTKALRRQRGPSVGWIAGAFGCLGSFLLQDAVLDDLGIALPDAMNADIIVLLAFPYLLLRFTGSFRPIARWMEWSFGTAAAGMALVTLLLPSLAHNAADGIYLACAFVYWTAVSSVTVTRFWSAGHGQPTLARRRMRLMSIATAVLSATLLVVVITLGRDWLLVDLMIQVAILLSAAAFGIGFSPPTVLRTLWVQGEQQHLLHGTMRVLRADTLDDVARQLLPPTARLIGAAGAALVDADGIVTATYGTAPSPGAVLAEDPSAGDADGRTALSLEGHGSIVVWTSAYTPFFGQVELQLLRAMAAVAALALERLALHAEQREQIASLQEAHQEAELARQKATRADLAKSEFLSRMSHELRTPLNAILGFGQLLELADLPEDDRTGVQHILAAGRHLVALIDDVLDISRVQAGEMTLSLEPVRVSDLVEESISLIRPLSDTRNIDLHLNALSCDAYVRTDRQRARQVLLNLLSNAVKYNHDGGMIEVTCAALIAGSLRISVRDTGPGIDERRQKRLFEPFQRLGAEHTDVQGTGLGLSVSKQLVQALGGQLGVVSEPGSGSTFWIELPLTDAPRQESESGTRSNPPVSLHRRAQDHHHKVLIIEDNLTNLRLVEAMLSQRPDLTLLQAQRGELGIQMAQQHRPEVIVLDLHLPDLPGRDVLHRLRADASTRSIPVIIASADAAPGRTKQLHEDGAFAYLTKPLELRALIDTIDAAIDTGLLAPTATL